MIIAIPTTGRVDQQHTLEVLRSTMWANRTVLVCPPDEVIKIRSRQNWDNVVPCPYVGIAPTRQWIMDWAREHGERYVCQASDDMRFARRVGDTVRLQQASVQDVEDMLDWVEGRLVRGAVHVGVSARSGNNREPKAARSVGRMNDLYAHDVLVLAQHDVRWDRLPVMEDFDVTLQLLRLGYPNDISYRWCWDQAATNQPGGCSTYRTPEVQEQGARGLAALHPGFVKVREAQAKNWKGFPGMRWDVTCYWQKAYESHFAKASLAHAQQLVDFVEGR